MARSSPVSLFHARFLNLWREPPGAALALIAAVLVALGIGAGLVLGSLLATPGARKYLRRAKRVEVQSLHTDTRSMTVVPAGARFVGANGESNPVD